MNKIIFGLILLALVFFLFSGGGACQKKPINRKEDYMESFADFVERVRRECDTYTEKDWARAVETYDLYSGPLFDKFGPDLDVGERLKVQKNKALFTILYQQFRAKEAVARGKEFTDQAGVKAKSITEKVKKGIDGFRDLLECE
jgi:hypothetical protein